MDPTLGDRIAELLARHGPALVLYARQWSDDPEDAVQEALIAIARQRPWPDRPSNWLFRATRNAAVNSARARGRRRRHEASAARGPQEWLTPAVSDGPSDAIDVRVLDARLRELAGELREVVVARIWGGLTFQEIGELTDTSAATAHRRFGEAIQELRRRLQTTESPMQARSIP